MQLHLTMFGLLGEMDLRNKIEVKTLSFGGRREYLETTDLK